MLVSNPNDVKIYNLSVGKSIPEWLSERKRRKLLKHNVDMRKSINLIQDFDMPGVSTSVRASRDGQYILATGIYKPRVKCFDVNQLSIKFERCFDAEVVTFEILSDDYSKLVFLHDDRNIEFHAAHGKYYKLRIPRFGRDMKYHYPSSDLFVVGASNEIYRINLERGQFLQSFDSESSSINKCTINPVHHLLLIGNEEGKVEAWDPRDRNKVGSLDCGFSCIKQDNRIDRIPSITALNCHNSLTLGVGTVTGQVLLYDLRSSSPYMIKDHMYGEPIRNIEFHKSMDYVYSMDNNIIKIWEKQTGKIYTSIEAESTTQFNDLCIIPDTGLMFIANEDKKLQTYFIPSLGPAPRWCNFLDSLTEELEELNYETIYDDYKFVTEEDLEKLDLLKYKGTPCLRAHMHGFFIDIRLYRKAMSIMDPFDFEKFKKKKIREKIEEERPKRIQIQKLPVINKDLAMKHLENESTTDLKKKKKATPNLLKDDRFKALFENPDFQVDVYSEEYALLNPVISQMGKTKKQRASKVVNENNIVEESDTENLRSEDEDMADSSDDEKPWAKEVRKQYKQVKENERRREMEERKNEEDSSEEVTKKQVKFYELKDGISFNGPKYMRQRAKLSLGDRLQKEEMHRVNVTGSRGNKEMTFTIKKKNFKKRVASTTNRQELKHLLRPANNIGKSKK
ncbi:nucleolar protein 10 [Phymastichus coffea]|uniref:nucleolar protein 10 n=1 Tax=Phymastichus coffea TaxID=108790 RepID=UPI00273BE319|nr:nucleolar protein 10 [Phymastichus coffea]